MKLISCQNGRIFTSLQREAEAIAREKIIPTGFDPLDELLPRGGFEQGTIHELLTLPEQGQACAFALFLAQRCHFSGGESKGVLIWCDPDEEIYPPALAASGISLERFYLLRPQTRQELIWSLTECLRCKGVAVTIAPVDRLSRIEARRLQLAAEHGGGMGILLRSLLCTRGGFQTPPVYAAATRWFVRPAPGERTVQRWDLQLIHGHGGRVGKTVILEHCHETNLVRAVEKLADRPMETIAKVG